MTPRAQLLAYRIRNYCHPRGWDVTVQEIATALQTTPQTVGRILNYKGWAGRVRAFRKHDDPHTGLVYSENTYYVTAQDTRDAMREVMG